MNDTGAARLSAGGHIRPHRPAAGDAHDLDHVVLLGFGMFFELYDLLFTAYVAPSLVKSGVLTAAPRPLRHDRGRELHRRLVHRPVHRHDPVRLPRRPLRAPGDLHLVASLVFRGQHHGGAAERRLRPQPLAARQRHRAWRRDGDHRRLFERARAQGDARPGVRGQPGDRLRLRAGRLLPRLSCSCRQRRSGSRAGAGWC